MTDIEERAKCVYPIKDKDNSCHVSLINMHRKCYIRGATDQDPISRADERKKVIEKLKAVMDSLMLDTKDKAAIIEAMEE